LGVGGKCVKPGNWEPKEMDSNFVTKSERKYQEEIGM
jgi:hypothetical protein